VEIQPLKYERYELLVVVLGCADAAARFSETQAIVADFVRYLKMMRL
jgi:hypothetical protein